MKTTKEHDSYYKSEATAEHYREFVPGTLYLYRKDNTHLIELIDLKDDVAGTYINNATVTAVLKDDDGEEIAGASWPLTLNYVASSNGEYRGVLSHELETTVGARLWAEVTAAAVAGQYHRRVPVLVIE